MSSDTPAGPCIRRPTEWYKRCIWMSVAASTLLWPLAIGISPILDNVLGVIASDVGLALAGTVTLTAVALGIGGAIWSALADNQDDLMAKQDALADRVDLIIRMLDGEPGQPEGELPPGTASKILKMGIRMGEKRSASEFPHLAPMYDQPRPADRG